ncbi:hypothetical protein LTR09_012246 [Extremus antarcticus]|uniref:Uncharacterized protein n=1 Tax=Extremus antarcticus TaxID=702011 RepID=A0AAJ0D564_9PEZI|nr:hypothetical protein LTR09_012246 [Extremus antarcticus]
MTTNGHPVYAHVPTWDKTRNPSGFGQPQRCLHANKGCVRLVTTWGLQCKPCEVLGRTLLYDTSGAVAFAEGDLLKPMPLPEAADCLVYPSGQYVPFHELEYPLLTAPTVPQDHNTGLLDSLLSERHSSRQCSSQ